LPSSIAEDEATKGLIVLRFSLYRGICRRRGLATAKVAVARKILTVIDAMLIETVISLVGRFPDRLSDNETLRKQEARLAADCQEQAPAPTSG
jgi:hypothetical protein